MKTQFALKTLVAVVALSLMVQVTTAAEYTFDKTHSEIGFQVKHLAISKVNGKFGDYSGGFNFVPGDPAAWTAQITIQAASINTENAKRDEHLRSADFFDAKQFPTLTFQSTGVTMTDDTEGVVTGNLTMHGVTKPVKLDLEFLGTVTDPWGNEKVGFSMSGKISRQEWGLNWNNVLESGGLVVSDMVKLMIEVEGNKVD